MHIMKNNYNIGLILIFFILILSIIIYFIKKKKTNPCILILGCSNSGKTALFSSLLYKKKTLTYTSMKENVGFYNRNNILLQIIDIPGNERICKNIFNEYKINMRGLIFMIDSEAINKELKDVAELLYTILIDPMVRSKCNEILIVCNKQDLHLAKGPAIIQMLLEKELNILRSLKIKELDTVDQEFERKKKVPFLGNRKQDFEFSHLKSINVIFTELVAYNNEENDLKLDGIISWLNKF